MEFTSKSFKEFRSDFADTVKELEKKHGININLGSITYDDSEFRVKITARKGKRVVKKRVNSNEFQVGDIVGINHKKVNSTYEFEVIKVNRKNVKVKALNGFGTYNVSPNLLVRK